MKFERIAFGLLATSIAVLLVVQFGLLYTFPQPDSARWWGDETGQMLELRAELQTGYAHIPPAHGSSLAITNGLVRGNSWLAAIIYGLPALLLSARLDLVTIGRTITFLLSLVLCFMMYRMMRLLRVPPLFALLGVLVLVSTRAFFFASHAARLDIAAGLSLLLFVDYLASRYRRLRQLEWQPTMIWYFAYGAIALLFATLSIHLLTLLGTLSVYMLWRYQVWRKPIALIAAFGGAMGVLAMLYGIYALSGAPISMFSPSVLPNQFQSVSSMLPILRPLSRSVQIANLIERINGLWMEAPQVVILVLITLVLLLLRRRQDKRSEAESFIVGASVVILIAWLFFESPALYYYVQVLPLFLVGLIASIHHRLVASNAVAVAIVFCAFLLLAYGCHDVTLASTLASRIERDNRSAIHDAIQALATDSKNARPMVLAQNPAIAYLEHDTSVRVMTAHLVSFPIWNAPLAAQIEQTGAGYLLLYATGDGSRYSDDYAALRPVGDRIGTVLMIRTGFLFDVHRNYFEANGRSIKPDTMILYKLHGAR